MIAPRSFRDALGLFPTGVAVVTTIARDGTHLGATVSSFNSVSLSPPLVLFSIARSASSFAAWSEADTYAINLLHEHQDEVSTRFARARTDKWEGTKPVVGQTGVLLIPGALAAFECENYARYDGGDHLILVGRVCGHDNRERRRSSPPYLLSRLISEDRALRGRYASRPGLLAAWLVASAHAGLRLDVGQVFVAGKSAESGWGHSRRSRFGRESGCPRFQTCSGGCQLRSEVPRADIA